MSFLIYGANGYTGLLIVELAVKNGLKPTIAGRTLDKIKPIADKFGLEYSVFDLNNQQELVGQLAQFPLVLNCAGPFSRTAKAMVEACLISKTHYLDITGEIEVFEMVKTYQQQALNSQIVLMPGVGFDVVPTDCMAKFLHTNMLDATHLELAFMSLGSTISHGTVTTMIESLGKEGAVRENGVITPKPAGFKGKDVNFGEITQFTMTIPWGDVSTAHHTTGIPNIETYVGVPKSAYFFMKFQFLFNPILRSNFIKNLLQNYVDGKVTGPTESQQQTGKSLIYGKVTNASGKSIEARLETPEGYKLTAEASLLITQKILDSKEISGYQTPAGMLGHDLILEVGGKWLI
jgi:short subunit dehydrogenase-like uncharacterized protein